MLVCVCVRTCVFGQLRGPVRVEKLRSLVQANLVQCMTNALASPDDSRHIFAPSVCMCVCW